MNGHVFVFIIMFIGRSIVVLVFHRDVHIVDSLLYLRLFLRVWLFRRKQKYVNIPVLNLILL